MTDDRTAIDEWLVPSRAALIVVDMQNDYIAADGHFARNGRDVSAIASIVSPIAGLSNAARAMGVPVFYTRQTALANGQSDSPSRRRYKALAKTGLGSSYPLIGSRGHEIFPALAPQPGDLVIDKYRSSAFRLTGLDLHLRTARRDTLIVCGAVTEGCIESTVRDAANYDYLPVIVGDAVASSNSKLHDSAMIVMSARYDVASVADIVSIWRTSSVTAA
jgi:ureidoacrylate peracid hydrolase